MTVTPAPVVSVLLPVFNGAATVRHAIASLRAQTFADWEMLVVDDGSTDGTRDIVAEIAREDRRVRTIVRPHEGLVAALNAGLAEARGEFVARMDADDESHPDRLAEQVALLRRGRAGEIGVAGCLVEFVGNRATNGGYALHVDWSNALVTPEQIALNRFVESPLAHPSVMFRRELVNRLGGYRAGEFPEDYELWLRWMDAGVRCAKVPRVLLRWHDRAGRLSRTDRRYDPEAFFRVKAEWVAREVERVVGARRPGAGRGFNPRSDLADGKGRAEAAPCLWIWGAGRPTRKRAAWLEEAGVRIAGYIDVDPKKATRAIGGTGRPVIQPDALPPAGGVFVLGYVSSRGARESIRSELARRGYVEGTDFLMCA